VLVIDEVVGLTEGVAPFGEAFGDVRGEMQRAVADYKAAVESGSFPTDDHSHVESDLDELY